MYTNVYEDCIINPGQELVRVVWPESAGHNQHREEPPALYIRESRPNPAIVDVGRTGTGETRSLVGSFPKARLALGEGAGEGAENPCGRSSAGCCWPCGPVWDAVPI